MEKRMELLMGLLMLLVVSALSTKGYEQVSAPEISAAKTEAMEGVEKKTTVVIDVGHGGIDPGKVSSEGVLEKDINLAISKKLKQFLESADIRVVMTREEDLGLYGEDEGNKKIADMRERCRLIEESEASLVVSVHQNSYHDEAVRGPQVFYYMGSKEGRVLAEKIQASFFGLLGEKNTRSAKGNREYYLLLHVKQPLVIVECGFLSNKEEAAKLCDEAYQEKVAWVIHMGILRYLNGEKLA